MVVAKLLEKRQAEIEAEVKEGKLSTFFFFFFFQVNVTATQILLDREGLPVRSLVLLTL